MLQTADPSREGRTTSSCIDMPWGPPAKASIILGWPDFGERKKHTDYILELLTYLLLDEIDHPIVQTKCLDGNSISCSKSCPLKYPGNQFKHGFAAMTLSLFNKRNFDQLSTHLYTMVL